MNKRKIRTICLITLAIGLCILWPIVLFIKGTEDWAFSFAFNDFFTFQNGFAVAAWFSLIQAHLVVLFAAFNKSVSWALAVLFVPLASIAFLIIHTELAKPAFSFLVAAIFFSALHLLIA